MNKLLPVNPKIIKCEIISTKMEECEIRYDMVLQHRIDSHDLSKLYIIVILKGNSTWSAANATVEKIKPINLYTSTISCLSRFSGSSCSGIIEISLSLYEKGKENAIDNITQNVDFK